MSLAQQAHPGNDQPRRFPSQRGVSMIEVLIALVLLLTTLLGATALQITGLQTNRSAYFRSQASLLAYDIADRIRLNASYASGDNARYSFDTSNPATPSANSCATTASGCSAQNLRAVDIREWSENFYDVTGIGHDGSAYKAMLPAGAGKVTVSGASFSVEVSWQELDWNIGGGSNKADSAKIFSLDFNA